MIRVLAIAASLSLAAFSGAHAETAETTADLRCLVVSFVGANNQDPALAQAATMAALYYLGRIDAREPELDLEKKLMNPEAVFAGQNMAEVAKSCGETLSARGKELQDIGARVNAAAKAGVATKGQKGT
jgi:hypothetical protein